jgi:hypothetical protein
LNQSFKTNFSHIKPAQFLSAFSKSIANITGDPYMQFSDFEQNWPAIQAALPIFIQGDNNQIQYVCDVLNKFLDFSGRWDERLMLLLSCVLKE